MQSCREVDLLQLLIYENFPAKGNAGENLSRRAWPAGCVSQNVTTSTKEAVFSSYKVLQHLCMLISGRIKKSISRGQCEKRLAGFYGERVLKKKNIC